MTSRFIHELLRHTKDDGAFNFELNAHKDMYETVAETILNLGLKAKDFESIKDYKLCIKNNVLFSFTWFVENPNGHTSSYGSTLDKALMTMIKRQKPPISNDYISYIL